MKRLYRIKHACVLFLLLAMAPAHAEVGLVDTPESHIIFIHKAIVKDEAAEFAAVLQQGIQRANKDKKPIFIDLNSQGGSIYEASEIAGMVHDAQLPVSVLKSSECASACFIIFLAARYKFAWHGARIGVHSASIENGQENAQTKETTVNFARYAKDSGAPDSVVGKLVTTKPDDIVFLSDAELKSMGVLYLDDEVIREPSPPSTPSPQAGAQPSYSVTTTPNQSGMTDTQKAETLAEQEANFTKYWKQIIGWSKAQHGGKLAAEKRCSADNCAIVVAYFDRAQRYVEAWRYNDTSQSPGKKLVCRQNQSRGQLSCTDWYDGHEFAINYTHQIGANLVSSEDDIFDLFK